MPESLPIAKRSRLHAVRAWLTHRHRLRAIALLIALVAGGAVWGLPQLQAWRHLRAAREELQHYHTAQAIRHLKVCREYWPADPEVLMLAARASRRAGVYGDTERLLAQYEQLQGRDDAYHFERLLLDAENNQDKVVDRCWKLIEGGHPDSPLLMEALARGYMRRYRLGFAKRCLDRWRESQPDNPQLLYLDGLFHLDYAHAPSAAVESYGRAVELDPNHEEARIGLAVSLLLRKEYARAAEQFERLRRQQPDNDRVIVGLAECRAGLGNAAEAVRMVDEVLARRPDFVSALAVRGQLAFRQDDYAAATEWLREAVARSPADQPSRYTLAQALALTGHADEAREYRRQTEQLKEDQSRFNDIVMGDIAKRPTDPALHCELGQILVRVGQRDEATRWFQSALQIDPNCAPARSALAELQRKRR